ncbi:MAG: fused MFS/spermidine synthase [Bacteroidota bacterium]
MGKVGKESWWQVLGSYISEITIEERSSPYNKVLQVILKNGRYQLCTENAIYSYDDLYTNFAKAFAAINVSNQPINDVLLLGLGLGSIPFILEKKFGVDCQLTAVEIDEEVIDLAHHYVLKDLKMAINAICTDARLFLQMDSQGYDLICMDVFQDDQIPEDFLGRSFLEQIQARLNPDGIFLFNHLALTKKDKKLATDYFTNVFRPFFPNATYIDADSNYVFLNHSRFLTAK